MPFPYRVGTHRDIGRRAWDLGRRARQRGCLVALALAALISGSRSVSDLVTRWYVEVAHAEVLTTEGIAGDVDKHHRAPVISVSTEVTATHSRILIDGMMRNGEFTKYPMQFDIFVNRTLYASQIRSPELPGPLGVDIPREVAAPPFNYAVVAKVLHPNRAFTSVLQGAVFDVSLGSTLSSCTVNAVNGADEDVVATASSVTVSQISSSSIRLDFTASGDPDDVAVRGDLTVENTALSGTLTFTTGSDSQSVALDGSGTRASENGGFTALTLSNDDESFAITCSE